MNQFPLYNNARIEEAKECIKEILENYCDEPCIVATTDKNYPFSGMDPSDIQPKKFNYNKSYADIHKKINEHPLFF